MPCKYKSSRLTLWSRVLLQNPTVTQLLKISLPFTEHKYFILHKQEPATGPYPCHMNPLYSLEPPYFFKTPPTLQQAVDNQQTWRSWRLINSEFRFKVFWESFYYSFLLRVSAFNTRARARTHRYILFLTGNSTLFRFHILGTKQIYQ
jgi:hypothetical protein